MEKEKVDELQTDLQKASKFVSEEKKKMFDEGVNELLRFLRK